MIRDQTPPVRSAEATSAPVRSARRRGVATASAATTLVVACGAQLTVSLTATAGDRAELLLTLRPGPLAAVGAVALAVIYRRHD